ncbi:helix-turn-helix transcriptional regulator [Lysobacter sp. ESA13C]|uniref:helix-turn-helix domain-containing protein n=1 Tax=Lysobacter sp. ESA13C TaxID=2862676 RepID=UPI001CBDA175|nr:helix-turn-helix transcriptional regulator [Lysobacter sp. ESA13C]
MKTIADLIDHARARSGIATDSAMGVRLGKSKQTMSQWRSGVRNPEDDDVVRLCRIAGEEPAEWLLIAQVARTTGAAHDAWLALARKFGAAASVALMVCVLSLVALPASAHGGGSVVGFGLPEQAVVIGIMRSSGSGCGRG